jgi:rod shape-determining protein MreD
MIKTFQQNVIRLLILVILQALVFNNIEISGYIIPYVYILFMILLPFDTSPAVTLLWGFVLGFSIDIFAEKIGMHTAATVFIAFMRPFVLSIFSPREGYEKATSPTIYYYGLTWFIKYSLVIIILHHLTYFYIEMFSMHDFFITLLRVILSTIFTATLIILSQYFIFRK